MYIGIIPPDKADPDHHITLTFNGHGEKKRDYLRAVQAVATAASWWHENSNGMIPIEFTETQVFPPNENRMGYVFYAGVVSDKLHRFRQVLTQELDRLDVYYSDDFEYTPHLTLGYGGVLDVPVNHYEGAHFTVSAFSVVSSTFGVSNIQV
jgi:2'-5' RNA ligase